MNWGNANRFYKPLKYEQGARFYKPRWKGEIHKQNAKQIPSISMYFKGQCFTDRSIRSSSFKQGLYNSKDHFSSITSPIDLRWNFYLRVSELQCLIFPFHMITFWFLSLQPQYLLFALNVLKRMVRYNRRSISLIDCEEVIHCTGCLEIRKLILICKKKHS